MSAEPASQLLEVQTTAFSGLGRSDQKPTLSALPNSSIQAEGFKIVLPDPESIRKYYTDKTPSGIAAAITLFDDLPDLSGFQKRSLLAYFIWHNDSTARFSEVKKIMEIEPSPMRDSQIDTYLDAVMDDEELASVYERIETIIFNAKRVITKNGGGNIKRRLISVSQAIMQLQDSNPEVEVDEAFVHLHHERINKLAEFLMIRSARIEFGFYDDGNPDTEQAIRALLKEGLSLDQIGKVVGLSRTKVGQIRKELGLVTDKESSHQANRPVRTESRGSSAVKTERRARNTSLSQAKRELFDRLVQEQVDLGVPYINLSSLVRGSGIPIPVASRLYRERSTISNLPPLNKEGRYGIKTVPALVKATIENAFAILSQPERDVIIHRYGIGTEKPKRVSEICKRLRLDIKKVLSAERSATQKLREAGITI